MRPQLSPRFVLLLGALVAATGCTTETPPLISADANIPMVDAGVVSECQPGLIDCGDYCANVATDSENCGSCGNACPTGLSCAVGRCDCAEPLLACDGVCSDLSSDPQNCGACGNACGASESCIEGACVVNCTEPSLRCPSPDGKGPDVCANVESDPMNCGGCGTQCRGGSVCNGGRCTCPSGQVSCSGVCTDVSSDQNNCGACLNSCGADGVCMGGACTTCGSELEACGSPSRCVDTTTSRLHCGACGNVCGPGESCEDGACACLPGFTDCDGLCANLDGDPRNCGGCGIDCGPSGTCSAGVCGCAAGTTMCGAECAVLDSNRNHCGGCDVACGAGESCHSGACVIINDSCETATAITGDLVITGEDMARGGTPASGDGCGYGSGNQALFYAVTIPPGQEVLAVADSSRDLVLFEQVACGESDCNQYSDYPEELTLSNIGGAADITRIIGVRPYSSTGGTTTYDIEFTYSTPVVAPNAICTAATEITADTSITGEDVDTGGPRSNGTGCGYGTGSKALYYAVTIPPGQEVAAVATSGRDLVVFEQAACGDTDCAAYSDTPEELTLSNVGGTTDVTRIFGVRSYSSSATTTSLYDIEFTYSTPVVAPNATCAAATEITANTSLTGEDVDTGGPRPSGTDCGYGTGSKALYYAVTIPAGQEVVAVATSARDLVVFEQAACGDTDCAAASDTPEELTLSNISGTAPITRIFGVRSWSSTSSTDPAVDIHFTYMVPAANASCTTATPITETTTITGEHTETGGPRPSGTDCGYGTAEKALYYAVTVPAGQSVDVETTPASGVDIVLFEQAACGDTDCADAVDSAPESLTLDNTAGSSDVTRIIGVRGFSAPGGTFPGGLFDIEFTYP